MKRNQGSVLLIIVGFIAILVSTFLLMINISHLIYEKQKFQNKIDQVSIFATNLIDLNHYYSNSILEGIKLDELQINQEVKRLLDEDNTLSSLKTEVDFDQLNIEASKNVKLPFLFGIDFIEIFVKSSAKLVVE